jgi:hypothetical protein
MSRKILVIGHKNPDTDSICSAIAYAELKNKLSEDVHIPKRAGDLTDETKYVLEKFHIETPGYIQDVGTQVRDIDIRKTEGVPSHISLKKAWGLMRDLKVATLPVTSGKRLEGLIAVKDIATANMDIYDNGSWPQRKRAIKISSRPRTAPCAWRRKRRRGGRKDPHRSLPPRHAGELHRSLRHHHSEQPL